MTHHDKARELVRRLLEKDKPLMQQNNWSSIRAAIREAADLITALAEENQRLREALEPFADVAEHDIGTDEADSDAFRPMFGVNRAPYLTVGHMRRALRALSSGEASHD